MVNVLRSLMVQEIAVVVIAVLECGESDLFEIVHTGNGARLFPCRIQSRQQHSCQNCNDSNNDEEFDKSKIPVSAAGIVDFRGHLFHDGFPLFSCFSCSVRFFVIVIILHFHVFCHNDSCFLQHKSFNFIFLLTELDFSGKRIIFL